MSFPNYRPKRMTLEDYQLRASETAIYKGRGNFFGLWYCLTKLNGEAGECAEKIGKAWRDDDGVLTPQRKEALALELGDTLWYISQAAKELGYSLESIALMNLEKLAKRAAENSLKGDGDSR